MPTGYTDDIAKGITFQQFAMNCARNFGACVTMRDDPVSKTIPDEFKPSDYHTIELAKAEEKLTELHNMTPGEADYYAKLEYEREFGRIATEIKKDQKLIEQYEAMLKQVVVWKSPTTKHDELKKFMISQINSSIEFDDMRGYYDDNPALLLSGIDWLKQAIDKAKWDIDYHTNEYQEECDRVNSRNQWIKDLRESLLL